MEPTKYEVHQLLIDDPNKGIVRIRANAFQGKRCIVRIRNMHGKSAYFEAMYADDAYMKSRQARNNDLGDNNLIFMSKSRRELLNISPSERVELEEIQREGLRSLYAVHSTLSDDSGEGWIWIRPSSSDTVLHKEIKDKRRIVRIKRKGAKAVYCEALLADPFYLENWQKKGIELGDYNVIFISAWYRRLLHIENVLEIVDLNVKPLRSQNLWALLYQYPRNHPQSLVLTANMMGIIGFGLGIIGTGLGIIGIKDWLAMNILAPYFSNTWTPFGFVICAAGFAITFLGITGFIRR